MARRATPTAPRSPDRITGYLDAQKLIPERFKGTEKFLDIVAWNIRFFDHKDPERVRLITDVLDAINADMFVLTEIADDGAMDAVVEELARRRAGFYSVTVGTTGGQQRVVLMWDRDWVRAKEMPVELFADKNRRIKDEAGLQKSMFPRLPLWGYFEARAEKPGEDGFTFELMGLHLKAQKPPQGWKPATPGQRFGTAQRKASAKLLAKWLTDNTQHQDEDIIIVGDWNAATDKEEWAALRALEGPGKDGVVFSAINPTENVTHLSRLNRSGPAGTRLDLTLVTTEADANSVPDETSVVIMWSFMEKLDGLDQATRDLLKKALAHNLSDHLPIVSRFYFTDKSGT